MSRKTKKRQSRKKRSTTRVDSVAETVELKQKKYESDFNPDYSDTIKDLKRIGILAGTFFIILVGLSFFLN